MVNSGCGKEPAVSALVLITLFLIVIGLYRSWQGRTAR
jgi:hypothetical protein